MDTSLRKGKQKKANRLELYLLFFLRDMSANVCGDRRVSVCFAAFDVDEHSASQNQYVVVAYVHCLPLPSSKFDNLYS